MNTPEMPINPTQAMFDRMSAAWQKERAGSQMTLGKFIAALEGIDGKRKITGIGGPISYRGYYDDLCFEPTEEARTVSEVLKAARSCMGVVFTGYKGGDFMMGESTPIWSAKYSECGLKIMDLNLKSNPISLVLAKDE